MRWSRSGPALLMANAPLFAYPAALGWPGALRPTIVGAAAVTMASAGQYVIALWREGTRARLLRQVRRTARPSGDHDVDAQALAALEVDVARAWRGRWRTLVVLLLIDALPVVAAARASSWWLALLVVVPLQTLAVRLPWSVVARQRLERLRGAVGDPTPWWHYRPARS